jgi:uncharacterized protein YjbJ (UPF0337 family)
MNKDQVKGTLKDIGGKTQQEAGKLVGSREQQVKDLQNQAKGPAWSDLTGLRVSFGASAVPSIDGVGPGPVSFCTCTFARSTQSR